MPVPVVVFCFRPDHLLKATAEALVDGGRFVVHVVAGPAAARRAYCGTVASVTRLPTGAVDDGQIVDIVLSLARRIGAAALLPIRTDDALFVARHRNALADARPVPVPEAPLIEQVAHKLRFAALVSTLGLAAPPTLELTPDLNVRDASELLGFPMLAKPVRGEGGFGITAIRNADGLRALVLEAAARQHMLLQQVVPGDDVALTLLADEGEPFAVMMRKRWFTRRTAPPFSAICDVEYFRDDWLEELGCEFVRATKFSGIADFDLRVDFASRRAWFLECDPRMMGLVTSARLFGVNIPQLLVDRARGLLPAGICARPDAGYFLSMRSIPEWLWSGAWRRQRHGPVRTNWRTHVAGPLRRSRICFWSRRLYGAKGGLSLVVAARARGSSPRHGEFKGNGGPSDTRPPHGGATAFRTSH